MRLELSSYTDKIKDLSRNRTGAVLSPIWIWPALAGYPLLTLACLVTDSIDELRFWNLRHPAHQINRHSKNGNSFFHRHRHEEIPNEKTNVDQSGYYINP